MAPDYAEPIAAFLEPYEGTIEVSERQGGKIQMHSKPVFYRGHELVFVGAMVLSPDLETPIRSHGEEDRSKAWNFGRTPLEFLIAGADSLLRTVRLEPFSFRGDGRTDTIEFDSAKHLNHGVRNVSDSDYGLFCFRKVLQPGFGEAGKHGFRTPVNTFAADSPVAPAYKAPNIQPKA